ncbi:MAG: outer membrane lipoprotein-sorting protein [Myxococcales bacterium]|nr:outer membrane lipoprotein-sorting protein [Myxococcales bacterium]
MLKTITTWALLVALTLLPGTARADSLSDLVHRADMVFRGKTSAAVFEMDVSTKSYRRKFKIVSWDDSRGTDKALVKILGPAAWRGHATLKVGDKLKLYDPKTNHVQVVGHSMLGDSWMGSHFSNDDLVKETRLARDYQLSLLKEWKGDAPVGDEATHYRVQMLPKPNAPVAWGKIVYELWDNDKGTAPLSAEYFRKASDKSPARTISFGDVKEMAGRYVPSTMTVRLASKPGEFTTITYEKLKLDIAIPDSKFTEQAMKH